MDGYTKLLYKIFNIPQARQCRHCGTVIDKSIGQNHNLCRACYRKWNTERKQIYNGVHYIAQRMYPERQLCQLAGCDRLGERHHPDYNKPEEIRWLCPYHHTQVKCLTDGV